MRPFKPVDFMNRICEFVVQKPAATGILDNFNFNQGKTMDFTKSEELKRSFPAIKRAKRLHSLVEARLAILLGGVYEDAYPKTEPSEMPGGRSDLAFYFPDSRYIIFEIFATVSQVPQDLRHLEQSNADVRIAVLTDPWLDNGAIYHEYFSKRPRDPYPWITISDVLVSSNKFATQSKLREIIDSALSPTEGRAEPNLQLKLNTMGRDRSLADELALTMTGSFPKNYPVGFVLINSNESTMARGLSIRLEMSWRGNTISVGPGIKSPRDIGWKTHLNRVINERPAVLLYDDPVQSIFFGQPIEWDNFKITLREEMDGYLQFDYLISTIEPYTNKKGQLIIHLRPD